MGNGMNHFREFCGFRLDADRLVLWHGNEPVPLPPKEIELLSALVERSNQVVSKDELMDRVWANSIVEESNISRHIYRLRKMFVERGLSADLIQTVPRRGYRFTGEITSNTNDLVIERHLVSRTYVESIHDTVGPLAAEYTLRPRQVQFVFATLMITALLVAAVGSYFLFGREPAADPAMRSIAVLPLNDLDDLNERSTGLGFADVLITRLGSVDNVRVLSTNSVIGLSGKPRDPIDVGRELGVDTVIDGTVQRANAKLRVTLRATRVADGKQIWSSTFDESENELFQLQDLMARQTAIALSLPIKDKIDLMTADREAYRFYVEGLYLFRQRHTSRSIPMFKRAIELDQNFAEAWSLMAAAYAMGDSMTEAGATVERAIQLDPELGQAHAVRGFVKLFLDWDPIEAERSFDRAIELDRNSVEAHHWRGILHQTRGRFEKAQTDLERALELDPTSGNMMSDLGYVHYFAREYDKAEELYHKAEAIAPNIVGGRMGQLYAAQGREYDALNADVKAYCFRLEPEVRTECESSLRKDFQKGGLRQVYRGFIETSLRSIKKNSTKKKVAANDWLVAANFYVSVGDKQNALNSLRRSIEFRTRYEITNFSIPFIEFDPRFDLLRGEPDFDRLISNLRAEL